MVLSVQTINITCVFRVNTFNNTIADNTLDYIFIIYTYCIYIVFSVHVQIANFMISYNTLWYLIMFSGFPTINDFLHNETCFYETIWKL